MVKNKKVKVALMVALAVVFTASVVSFAALYWYEQGKTVNEVTLATVRGSISEVYEQDPVVYPGEEVVKIVSVKNTGTVDSITRVQLELAWGTVDPDSGSFIPDDTLPTENIEIDYNTEDWTKIGEHYYYNKILKPDETSNPVIKSFRLDGFSTGNAYAGLTGHILVKMEMMQAAGGAESAWNITYEELNIDYVPGDKTETTTTVDFNGRGKGFSFKVAEGDLFYNYKNMVPGESETQLTTITNNFDKEVEIRLWAENDTAAFGSENTELVKKLLEEYSELTVTDKDGNVLYEGSLLPSDTGERLNVSLGKFAPEETKDILISLQISPEVGYDFKELAATLVWGFEAMGEEDTVAPPTGDKTLLYLPIFTALLSAGLFIVLTAKSRKKATETV